MAKKNRPKKSKALVVWAIVTVIVLLADCVGNYLVVGLPGNMNSLLDKPMAAIGEAIDFKLSAGELGGLMDTLFGSQRPIYSDEVTSVYPTQKATNKAEAFANAQEVNLKLAEEGFVLLKNENAALPMNKGARISVFSKNSVNLSYGGSGSGGFDTSNNKNLYESLNDAGFVTNPTLKRFYESSQSGPVRTANSSDLDNGDNQKIATAETPQNKYTDAVRNSYVDYSDAALVVITRIGGEGFDLPRYQGDSEGAVSPDSHYLELDQNEIDLLTAVTDGTFKRVVVVFNTPSSFEAAFLKDSAYAAFADKIDAAVWIGFTGSNGITALGEILNGDVNPSGRLVDTWAADFTKNPSFVNFGTGCLPDTTDKYDGGMYYSVDYEEGIYVGYRYYETRGETDGEDWYNANVVYPFGYGMSYTTFEQTLDSVVITGDKRTATVTVTTTNTGDVAGKAVVQLYASAPYTDYDKQNGIEKSALQLMDYEKTNTLQPGESQTITMNVDMSLLASYDSQNAKTFIVDPGDYYFAIGSDAHDALNNILAAQGKTTADGMTADGDASKTYQWTWDGAVDADTFSVSKAGVEITNAVSDGDYSMDINTFIPGTATYLSRSDWDGTFPTTITGLKAEGRLATLLANDFIDIKTDEDTSDIVFGDTTSTLTLNDLKGADFDDSRWDELVGKVTIDEFLNFASNAFHNIQNIDSVGLPQYAADDGPNGSDSHYLTEGSYQGTPYADAADYDYGTRVGPTPENIAYSWNKELAYRVGEITLGESTLVLNLPIMIGPGMNIHRHGYNARGAEYYSEDPVLSGYTGSAVVQGAQSKGTLVNIKHAAFNDQEINRSGIAVFMTEQKARELELRNLQQAFEGNGKPASFEADPSRDDTYTVGALGVMTSYNRIGAVASSANAGVQVQIMRNEWGFKGYNVTDFTGVTLHASPKESILAGTTAFCGFGTDDSITYWNADALKGDRTMLLAIKQNIHYLLYALANSAAMNGVNSTTRTISVMTWWRMTYRVCIYGFAALTALCALLYVVSAVKSKKQKTAKEA